MWRRRGSGIIPSLGDHRSNSFIRGRIPVVDACARGRPTGVGRWALTGAETALDVHQDGTAAPSPTDVRSLVDSAEQALHNWLAAGRYRQGDRLPPEHEVATMLGVSRGTLRSALQRLEEEGKIVRRQGSGTFVGHTAIPTALDPFLCNRYEIAEFARDASALGVRYLGVCCGAGPHMIRSMAEALDRTPPASRYSPDMTRHAFLGSDPALQAHNQEFAKEL